MKWLSLCLLLIMCLDGCLDLMQPAPAPSPQEYGEIEGGVVDAATGVGIPNVKVMAGAVGAYSDSYGHFRLINLPAGPVTIAAAKAGYREYSGVVSVEGGKTSTCEIRLSPSGATYQQGVE